MVDDDRHTDDGRTPDHGHPISSPCSPGWISIRSPKRDIWMDLPSYRTGAFFHPKYLLSFGWFCHPYKMCYYHCNWMLFPSNKIVSNWKENPSFQMPAHVKMANHANSGNIRRIKIEWSIKGFHIFRVRPHPDILLKVVPEPSNRYDPNAMKVILPPLTETPAYLQEIESVRQNEGMAIIHCVSIFERKKKATCAV